jgi:hypothetical protein
VRNGQQRVLLVTAVERSAHLAHRGHDGLPRPQIAVCGLDDLAGTFDPDDPRELDGVARSTAAGDELGTVETEGSDADQHPAGARDGDRTILERQHAGTAGLVDDNCSHAQN